MLFEEKSRTRKSPMRQGERVFSFYDSSGRQSFAIYRDLLNIWIAHYPDSGQSELARRFLKGSDAQYYAALAEFVVHEALLSSSGKIKYHPAVPFSSARPDFLKLSMSGDVEAYVEVTTCAPAEQDVASGHRLARIYDAVEKIRLPPGYYFNITVEKHGKTSPSLAGLKNEITQWLKEAQDNIEIHENASRMFDINDWRVALQLMRFSDPAKLADRSIGAYFTGARWIDGSGDVRTRLEVKARRYGLLDAPFLLVIADCKGEIGWGESAKRELIEALFGNEAVTVFQDMSGDLHAEPRRDLNGLFGYPDAPKNRNVSAVLLLPQPDLWGMRNPLHQPLMVHNPWSQYPLPQSVLPITSLQLGSDGQLHEEIGLAFADLLGLPPEWPPPF